ncbi:hypothetical protein [Pseudobutyrivibrio sp. LB2011]|uniref:hypothetical protein n=1 Tax=Pseudobutyrivibrio sp. LB2011 TaxID=1408312 RepID=UPI0005D2174A|nr:hypothetical protein [Pseudobutyrivibrio sp. LB2011]
MSVTIALSVIMMLGLFLMLLGGVGFVQDKRFFSSAPKEVLDVVPETKSQRFAGQHILGWIIISLAVVLMIAAVIIEGYYGVKNESRFLQQFLRFMLMFLGLKAFDIGFFDWFLLCNAGLNFFPHFYPETKPVLNKHLFGYNWKTHLLHVICIIPVSALLAGMCLLF